MTINTKHSTGTRFPEHYIADLASRYDLPQAELDLMANRPAVQLARYLTRDQLQQLANWKSLRSAGWIRPNSENFVREIAGLTRCAPLTPHTPATADQLTA